MTKQGNILRVITAAIFGLLLLELSYLYRIHRGIEDMSNLKETEIEQIQDDNNIENESVETSQSSHWIEMMQDRMKIDPVTKIRSWGCNLEVSPVIFIHIGKCGGGSARPKFKPTNLGDNGRAPSYCNAVHKYFLPETSGKYKSHQGSLQCDALTPLGHAIACPEPVESISKCSQCHVDSETCNQAYVGHNFLGSELHWLPPKLLSSWWESTFRLSKNESIKHSLSINNQFNNMSSQRKNLCDIEGEPIYRPRNEEEYRKYYSLCSEARQSEIDDITMKIFLNELNPDENYNTGNMDWSPLYASLPVLRATVVREPFSWLVTKFFWHLPRNKVEELEHKCVDADFAIGKSNEREFHNIIEEGWANRHGLKYLLFLCGEDCSIRYKKGISSIKDLEKQAEGNLRQSIAVVGLLEDMDTFYQMLTDRVVYLDAVTKKAGRRNSRESDAKSSCSKQFQDPDFQKELMERSEVIAALVRLYKVAQEVNSFQVEELSQCMRKTTLIATY